MIMVYIVNLSSKKKEEQEQKEIKDLILVTDPSLVLVILHEKKRQILNILLNEEMNIQDLKKATGLNPGTVKRHLDDLIKNNLVFISSIKINDYNIKMKYYRALAKKIKISITLPESN